MTENILKEQIRKLVEIQKVDSQIYAIKNDLEEKPIQIEALTEEFELVKQKLNALEAKLKDIQLKRKEKELELQEKEGEIAKANSQLLQIKTNKEYTAKINEIESVKADKSQIEEQVLIFYDEADKVRVEADAERQAVSEKEKQYLADKQKIEEEITTMKGQLTVLEANRNSVLPGINPELSNRYERLLKNKNGLALVAVYSGSCGGCYMNLAPQVINALKLGEEIVSCETCSRLLYLEDEL